MATPNFTILLQDAVNKPGSIMQAYSAFHHYSLGNQLLALFECHDRDATFTTFVYTRRWFVLAQTEGQDIEAPTIPTWDADNALSALDVHRVEFTVLDGNCQGYAQKRSIAISPVAQLPHKTLFHEIAHVILGHTSEADFSDSEQTPKSLREVEAEAVALLCCEALDLEGAEFCRGYIQEWLKRDGATAIPEKSAQKILLAADQILKAGKEQV